MATSITSAVAAQDASGNFVSLVLAGTSSDCPGGTLTIQVSDAATGALLALGNAPYDGSAWSKTLTVPDDIAAGQIACGQTLQVSLTCQQGATVTSLPVSPDTVDVVCVSACVIAIGTAQGVPSVATGLDQLTIRGTATGCTSVRVVAVQVGRQQPVSVDAGVGNGQWTAVFVMGAPGVGTSLKAFDCNADIDVTATCNDGSGCSTTARVPVTCGGDCIADVAMEITRVPDGQVVGSASPTCETAGSGDYNLRVTGPAGGTITIIRWQESTSTGAASTVLVDGAGSSITANPLTVTIAYPADQAVNFTYTALVHDGQGCLGIATATFSCGGDLGETPGAPRDCEVSEWSNWGPCINGVQRRTRAVVVPPANGGAACPALEQTRACPPVAVDCEVSAFSAWGPCIDGIQRRTRQVVTQPANGGAPCPALEQTRRCGGSNGICDPCCIWNWINIGLFIAAAILILVTFCLLDATVVAAILALGSGGTLAAVFAALTAVNIAMLVACAILMLIGLASWLAWLAFCLPGNPNACSMLATLMLALSTIVLLSFVLFWIMLGIGMLGCVAGTVVNFAWFGFILAVTTLIYGALGCFEQE